MSTLHLKGIEQMIITFFSSGTFELRYMSTSFTPNSGTQSFWSDISASEAAGAPTVTLANPTVTIDVANDRVGVSFDDVSNSNITTSTNQFAIIKQTGTDSTSPILGTFDIATGTLAPSNDDLSLTFNVAGVFALSAT